MVFYAAKVIWFLIQPSTVLFILVAAALWWTRAGRTGPAIGCLAAVLAIGLAALSPLPNLLTLPLEQRFPRADLTAGPVAGFIILGGAEDAEVAQGRHVHALDEAGERISEAVELARRLPKAQVVFTGGSGALFPGVQSGAEAVRDMLTGMGVAPDRIVLEDRSRDTFENAVFTKAILHPKVGDRWLLITSAWHMPRSIGVFRKAGFAVEAWPVDYRTTGWGSAQSGFRSAADGLKRLETVSKEYAGLLAYWLQGRSSRLFPAPCTSGTTCD
jgi:uncharacterized SAM-binding protein YcdF (DUF218 family)